MFITLCAHDICMNDEDFCVFLDNMLLDDLSRMHIKSLLSYFTDKRNGKPANKSYLFYGDIGIGKTYFAKTIIELMDKEVIFCGKSAFRNKKTQVCRNFDEVLGKIDNSKEQIIFLDDLLFLLRADIHKSIIKIFDIVKRNQNKIMIATIENKAYLDDDEVKRIEVKIEIDVPSFENKRLFLRTEYGNYLNGCQIDYIACNSFDYDYNDLSGLVKLACSHKEVTDAALRKIMGLYRSKQSCKSVIYRDVDTGLRDILGRKHIKTCLKKLMHVRKNPDNDFGLKYSNILFFCGLPGTGKTFTAKALAGEMNKPLVVVNISEYEDCSFQRILAIVRRYENCIIFVEGAENIIDYYGFDELTGFRTQLNYLFDGADKAPRNSILIFAVYDPYLFARDSNITHVLAFYHPGFAERRKFFRMKINPLRENVDINYLARNTDGSYWDLERLCDEVVVCYLQEGRIDKKALKGIVGWMRRKRARDRRWAECLGEKCGVDVY